MRRGSALLFCWLALAAAGPRPLAPPPPDLRLLVPWANAPLDKPPVVVPHPAPPAVPSGLPSLPPVAIVVPRADRPIAYLPPPRALPCVGAWLRIASESLECGRARFQRGEYEEAFRALDQAVRGGSERDLLVEARYWLGETLSRLGRMEQADWLFRQVAQEQGRQEFGPWALHASGWTALRLKDYARAREAFTQLLAGPVPAVLDGWARHGLGLALYALGRHAEAEQVWAALAGRAPPALERDILFWHAETLARIGQPARAADDAARFTQGGPHPLLDTAMLRRAWWNLLAGRVSESVAAFRAAPAGSERDWTEAGLALALLASDDWDGARATAAALESRRSPLATPVLLRLAAGALDRRRPADAHAMVQTLLAGNLPPPVRAWVLVVQGEADRLDGNRDDARTQYDLARSIDAATATGRFATLRLAQTNFELREFAQVQADLAPLLARAVPAEMRLPVLVLQAEAAYQAADYATAATAYRQALVEFPDAGRLLRLAAAWSALRQRQADEARRGFIDFAGTFPDDPHAADALVLASELALGTGDLDGGRALIEQVLARYPAHPRADFARLNRAILLLRSGQMAAAQSVLRDWIARAPFPPLLGRAHLALGAALLQRAPAEAAREFQAAQREGLGAVANLGLGAAALAESRWDQATRELGEARDTGTAAVTTAAEYGLAVVAFHRGPAAAFKAPARIALDAAPRGPNAAGLLYVLAGLEAGEKDWTRALADARRLAGDFPAAAEAPDALERIGAAAAAAKAWPVVYEAYALLTQQFPQSPFAEGGRLLLAEALLETGRAADARRELERFVAAASPNDPRIGEAWIALARAREATGDRAAALEAYARAARDPRGPEWTTEALLGHGRLLLQDKRWEAARAVLGRLLASDDTATVAVAAAGIGDAWQGEGDQLAAAEYYMTAAYLAPESSAGRRALLGAARSFAALRQPAAAATVYGKLLAQANVPADLAAAARQGLAEIKR